VSKSVDLCGDCWSELLPDEYEPATRRFGTCDVCEANAFIHRTSSTRVPCRIRQVPNPKFADRPDGDRFLLDACVTHGTDVTDAFGHYLSTRPSTNSLGFAVND
jgi:hypothetical protein